MPSPEDVMIPAGSVMGMFDYNVTLNDDGIVEGDETFTLSLPDQSSVPYTIGANSTLNATIENDDRMYIVTKIILILLM